MYKEFLEAVLAYVTSLNETCEKIDEENGLAPYVNFVPVLMENELCGFIVDEIGGAYSYREASPEELAWWYNRPWKHAS